MMTRKKRRTFTADEKLNAVRRHLIDKVPVSDFCDELGLQPTQIYQWLKLLFDNGGSAFGKPGRKAKQDDSKDRQIETLKSKIQTKLAGKRRRRDGLPLRSAQAKKDRLDRRIGQCRDAT